MAHNAWPQLATEELPWELSEATARFLDVFDRHRRSRPYRAAVPGEIAHADALSALSAASLEAAERAAVMATRFSAQQLDDYLPAILLRTESASSSQIERINAGARAVAVAMLGDPSKEQALRVAANTAAMTRALEHEPSLSTHAIQAFHRELMRDAPHVQPGVWRTETVWIGADSLSPHNADYVAPHHSRVPVLLADLEAFAARTELPAVVHAALAHAQFETIHPFTDGNGRTGRVLIHQVLRLRGVISGATVPVSTGILRDTNRYFAALTAYRAGQLDPIVQEVAASVMNGVATGTALADAARELRTSWEGRIRARRGAIAWRLADLVLRQPVVDTAFVTSSLGVSMRGALNALDALTAAGVLSPASHARRGRRWVSEEAVALLDRFAAP